MTSGSHLARSNSTTRLFCGVAGEGEGAGAGERLIVTGTSLGAGGGVDGPADGIAGLAGGGAASPWSFARRFRRI
jgi:hypothetical protein